MLQFDIYVFHRSHGTDWGPQYKYMGTTLAIVTRAALLWPCRQRSAVLWVLMLLVQDTDPAVLRSVKS